MSLARRSLLSLSAAALALVVLGKGALACHENPGPYGPKGTTYTTLTAQPSSGSVDGTITLTSTTLYADGQNFYGVLPGYHVDYYLNGVLLGSASIENANPWTGRATFAFSASSLSAGPNTVTAQFPLQYFTCGGDLGTFTASTAALTISRRGAQYAVNSGGGPGRSPVSNSGNPNAMVRVRVVSEGSTPFDLAVVSTPYYQVEVVEVTNTGTQTLTNVQLSQEGNSTKWLQALDSSGHGPTIGPGGSAQIVLRSFDPFLNPCGPSAHLALDRVTPTPFYVSWDPSGSGETHTLDIGTYTCQG